MTGPGVWLTDLAGSPGRACNLGGHTPLGIREEQWVDAAAAAGVAAAVVVADRVGIEMDSWCGDGCVVDYFCSPSATDN